MMTTTVTDNVKEYYGKVLQGSKDLKTSACSSGASLPQHVRSALDQVHEEVRQRYYGCGFVVPESLQGARILDLGSGSGRDCYLLSRLVGEKGSVVGVEMTDQQIEVARRHIGYHTRKFGYARPNVDFRQGYIERLDELGLEENSFDIIVSNCVINLSPDKQAVLEQAYRLLKPGGELYFSDVYADRRVPQDLVDDPVLYGECLSGALYWNDFLTLSRKAGFQDPRLVEDHPIAIDNEEIARRIGHISFFSATYRLFKIEGLESACEDYGQAVVYRGTIAYCPQAFVLDKHHRIDRGKVFPVCGNTYRMLKETRFSSHFKFVGDWSTHYGIFEGCGSGLPFDVDAQGRAQATNGCC
ncbi:MAG TPA: methyltransferase domain-containing protein [Acidobacteriota bacterium]|nr:methyltransferase domain-containing protein [Acidobacteriota bacterium]